jgi:hypothetical protein
MSKIFGYGEDALTLWLLKNQPQEILKRFKDKTKPSDCLIFYRPSFGRNGGKGSAEFGEFDAILASRENVFLIESKWDNHRITNRTNLMLRPEQTKRHKVFQWYLRNWNDKYSKNWHAFIREKGADFIPNRMIAPAGSLLATNLHHILNQLHKHCPNCSNPDHVQNILLFFHSPISKQPKKTSEEFTIAPVEYDESNNYVPLS